MSSPNRLPRFSAFVAASAAVLAVSAPVAKAEPLVHNPYEPGYHRGSDGYYVGRMQLLPDWFERRDSITLQAGDAVAANKIIQARDPWPPYVARRNIPFNGVVMDSAVDRYKAGTVLVPPVLGD